MMRTGLAWGAVGLAAAIPIFAAAYSPLLQWREPIYIVAGFSGIFGLAVLLVQPLLIARVVPARSPARAHFWAGMALVFAVVLHVVGLWITSPPDVMDVLLFRSPTPFAVWGAIAMWAVVGAAALAVFRNRLPPRIWRAGHSIAVSLAVVGTVVHALQIQGAMEDVTKGMLCLFVIGATAWAIWKRRVWRIIRLPG